MEIKHIHSFGDWRGDLTPLEFSDLPFTPKRLFIVKNCGVGMRRGEHAHYTTQQLLICLKGEIKVVTHNGKKKDEGILKEGHSTLIESYHWDYQEFLTGEDILLVICSTLFNLDDYILDFDKFKEIVKGRKND